jgi:hypothetical protein
MLPIPKHEPNKKTKGAKKTRLTLADMPHVAEHAAPVITLDVDMSGVEAELANLAHSVKSYLVNSYEGEHKLKIFTGPEGSGYHPVLIALERSDSLDEFIEASNRIATAFERIADAMSKGVVIIK